MKKSIIAAVLAGTMLLSGCSGVSVESALSSHINSNNSSTISSFQSTNSSSSTSSTQSSITVNTSSSTDSTSSEPQTEISVAQYTKENFIPGALRCDDWYYKETVSGNVEAVLYVGDYSEIDDVDEFISKFYGGLLGIMVEVPDCGMYTYWVFKENGSYISTTFSMFGVRTPVIWSGDYAPLNENINAQLFNAIWSDMGLDDQTTSQPSSSSQSESQTPPVESTPTYISLYDDPIVNISFYGIEKYSGKECVVFIVENKNNFAIEVWEPTVALDGLDLGEMSGRYEISPNSKGTVYFYKDDKSNIDNKSPSTVSGSLTINAKGSEKINGQRYYDISFSGNV